MFIRSSLSLGRMPFHRPLSILARPAPRVVAAPAKLGLQPYTPSMLFNSSPTRLPPNKDRHQIENAPPSKSPPTDARMDELIPGFSRLGVDQKVTAIRAKLLKTQNEKGASHWKPGEYEALVSQLALKEKEIRDADWRNDLANAGLTGFIMSLFF